VDFPTPPLQSPPSPPETNNTPAQPRAEQIRITINTPKKAIIAKTTCANGANELSKSFVTAHLAILQADLNLNSPPHDAVINTVISHCKETAQPWPISPFSMGLVHRTNTQGPFSCYAILSVGLFCIYGCFRKVCYRVTYHLFFGLSEYWSYILTRRYLFAHLLSFFPHLGRGSYTTRQR
jgi:hypothetical protein